MVIHFSTHKDSHGGRMTDDSTSIPQQTGRFPPASGANQPASGVRTTFEGGKVRKGSGGFWFQLGQGYIHFWISVLLNILLRMKSLKCIWRSLLTHNWQFKYRQFYERSLFLRSCVRKETVSLIFIVDLIVLIYPISLITQVMNKAHENFKELSRSKSSTRVSPGTCFGWVCQGGMAQVQSSSDQLSIETTMGPWWLFYIIDPQVMPNITIENGHRYSEVSHLKWWILP